MNVIHIEATFILKGARNPSIPGTRQEATGKRLIYITYRAMYYGYRYLNMPNM